MTEEAREIRGLRDADLRDQFVLEQEHAVRLDRPARPPTPPRDRTSSTSAGTASRRRKDLFWRMQSGNSNPVTPEALARLFSGARDGQHPLRRAQRLLHRGHRPGGLSSRSDCVIGMSGRIPDKSAIAVLRAGFYQALGFGRSIKTAFDLGCVAIDASERPGKACKAAAASDNPARDAMVTHTASSRDDTPKLKVKVGVDPAEIYLAVNTITARALPGGARSRRVKPTHPLDRQVL